MTDQSVLTVNNLRVKFDRHLVLKDVSFSVHDDEMVAIIGPNGAGKTTLFRAILGLIPYEGQIIWRDNVKIGYVPQKLSVDPDLPLTTKELFALKEQDTNEMDRVLHAVGFAEDKPHRGHLKDHIINQKIGALSGGELQRVLIAWSLLGNPDVLLFDEPTSGIDISAEESIYSLLHRLQEQQHLTVLLISHELQIVYQFATSVLCLNKTLISAGPPTKILKQTNLEQVFGPEIGMFHHREHGEHQ